MSDINDADEVASGTNSCGSPFMASPEACSAANQIKVEVAEDDAPHQTNIESINFRTFSTVFVSFRSSHVRIFFTSYFLI